MVVHGRALYVSGSYYCIGKPSLSWRHCQWAALRNFWMEKDLPVASEALISPVVLSCVLLLNATLLAWSLHVFSNKSFRRKSWLLMPGICGPLAPLSLPALAFLFLFVVQRTSKIRNCNASSVQAPWSSSYRLQLSACVSLIAHKNTKRKPTKKRALPVLWSGTQSFTNRYYYLVLCLWSQRRPEHVYMHVRFAHQSLPVFSCFRHWDLAQTVSCLLVARFTGTAARQVAHVVGAFADCQW